MEYIIAATVFIVVLLIIYVYINIRNKAVLKKEELERKNSLKKQELKPFLSQITDFNVKLRKFKSLPKYISGFDLFKYKLEYDDLYKLLNHSGFEKLTGFDFAIREINFFLQTFENLDSIIATRNDKFIENEINDTNNLLSDVEGKSLDKQQRKAIVIDEDNQLVIAGAGSGKTTTIAGKVKYLTSRKNVDPNRILLISFTRKSAEEMRERIFNKMNINTPVKTFNKLGLDIIAEVNNLKPSVYDADGKTRLETISSFIEHAKKNEIYFDLLIDFFAYYLKPYKDISDFTTDAEHNNYLNEQKLEGYKTVSKRLANGVVVTYRERFKSQEEVLIANFLFRNGIRYEYEEKYEYKTASKKFSQYKPDFYLPDYNIYIEHFGVDENWNVPNWFKRKDGKSAKEIYNEGIEWKRQEHRKNQTILIETYSWQQSKGILLAELQDNLEKQGVIFRPISNKELWQYINDNAKKDITDFTQLVDTFLVLLKSNNENITSLKRKAFKEKNERAVKFLQLFEPIYYYYQDYLVEKDEIDFSDMINNATDIIQTNQYQSQYDYIIIDEYQDISKGRFELIKALLNQKPNTKLFCVGDDWQSIYRFAGSDIGLFTNFEGNFKSSMIDGYNRKTTDSFIEYTYRFKNKMIELSSNFILKNPNQISKSLKSHSNTENSPYTIYKYSDPVRTSENLHLALKKSLVDIYNKSRNEETTVLILGRYDFERKNLIQGNFLIEEYNRINEQYEYKCKEFPNLNISFLTAHRSKGLQADYVIISNCSSGTYGFPSEISDDPLLNFLLSKADHFPNGEERRLFYVAMTRAIKHVYFLVNLDYPSKFIDEIEENEKVTGLQCEWCDNGRLIERHGKYGYFYACNNYHYCNYTKNIDANDFKELGDEYYLKKDFQKAIVYLEKYLTLTEGDSESFYLLGKSYEKISNFKKSLLYLNKAISTEVIEPYYYYLRGSVHYDLEMFKKAIDDWLYFDEMEPNRLSVNFWLSKAYFKSRNIIKAIKYINKEVDLNPGNEDAKKLKNQYITQLENRFKTKETSIKTSDPNTIKSFLQFAIDFNVNVKFNYHKSIQFEGGLQSVRTIKPKGFKVMGRFDSLCVFGYCYLREKERTFNIERISNLIINPDKIEYWSD